MSDTLVKMTDNELERVKLLEAYLQKKIKQIEVAEKLGITTRQVRRLKKAYRQNGVTALIHGLRGRTSNHQSNPYLLEEITKLITTKYAGYSPNFVFEMLTQIEHRFHISDEKVRQIMIAQNLWIPKKQKRIAYHPLRARREMEGELVQLDGSPDYYLGREYGECCLIVFVDDATGKIFAYLCEVEDTINYLRAMKPYFLKHGIPRAFYVDRFSVFAPPAQKGKEFTNKTQFYRVCRELDIELILANSPQAKGRVEKANDTLQGRLIQMFAYKKFTCLSEANSYLQNFYLDFINTKFAVIPASKQQAARYLPSKVIDEVLVIKEERQLSKNLTCQYNGTTYQLFPNPGQSYLCLGVKQKIQVITDLENKTHFKVSTPKGMVELKYQIKEQLKITPVISRKQVDLYLKKLSEAKSACQIQKNPWEEFYR
jgi:transposase